MQTIPIKGDYICTVQVYSDVLVLFCFSQYKAQIIMLL